MARMSHAGSYAWSTGEGHVMKLSMRIRKARRHAESSQQELADRIGVSRGAVANWECADAIPAARRMTKIALATGVAYEWLATGRGRMLLDLADDPSKPAVDADFVDDPAERSLLEAFRLASRRARKQAMDILRASARRSSE